MPDDEFADYYRKGPGPGSPEHTIMLVLVVLFVAAVCWLAW